MFVESLNRSLRWTWLSNYSLVLLNEHAIFKYIIDAISTELHNFGVPHSIQDAGVPWQKDVTYMSTMLLATRPRPPRYIIYNFEQLVTDSGYFGPGTLSQLQGALEVWDYSMVNVAFLQQQHGLLARFVPLSYTPGMQQFDHATRKRLVDASFIGCMNDRRNTLLGGLITAYEGRPKKLFITKKGCFVSLGCFGNCLKRVYKDSRVGINMHYYGGKTVLEVHRILPYIANRVIVISERSDDAFYDGFLSNLVTYVRNADGMQSSIAYIASLSTTDFDQLVNWRYELFKSLPSYANFLHQALCAEVS